MAILTKPQIQALIDSNLLDNTTGEISPLDLREVCEALNDSFFNLVTNQDAAGLSEWDNTLSYKINQCAALNGDIYQADVQTTIGAFIGAEWTLISAFSESTSGLGGFLLKDNGFELEAGKLVNVLGNDVDLNILDTGVYKAQQVSAPVGLANEYPIAGKSLVVTYKSNVGTDSLQYLYPHTDLTRFYVRKLDGSSWVLNDMNVGSLAPALVIEGANSIKPSFGTHTLTSANSQIFSGDNHDISGVGEYNFIINGEDGIIDGVSWNSSIINSPASEITGITTGFGDSNHNHMFGGNSHSIKTNGTATSPNQNNMIIGGGSVNMNDSVVSTTGNNFNMAIGSSNTDMSQSSSGNVNVCSDISSIGSEFGDATISGIINGNNCIMKNTSNSTISGNTSTIDGFTSVHILGDSITADANDTTFVSNMNITTTSGDILKIGNSRFHQFNLGGLEHCSIAANPAVDSINVLNWSVDVGNSPSIIDMVFGYGAISTNLVSEFGTSGNVINGNDFPVFVAADSTSEFHGSLTGSVIIGGTSQIIATQSNSVYVPDLRAQGTIYGDGSAISRTITQLTVADSPYTASWGEDLEIDCTNTNVTVNLPTAVGNNGLTINITKVDATNKDILIVPNGAETILTNGATDITAQYQSVEYKSNGTNISLR